MVATLEQKTAYSVLFLSQLKVREIDWRDEIAFSINYLNFNAAEKLLQTVKKELSKPQAAEQTPKKWCRQQLFILRKPQKTAFKERGQKALSQLSNRLRYCCLNMNLFRTEFASFLPSSKVLKQLLAAIKVAEGWCDLEDSVIEFTAHTTLKGHAKLENAITKIAKNACKEAESLRDSMLGE
ncbi:MAG: hypothetical protein JXA52_02985 [Planctomycetes bacterium]|nr:hypothetical protein [Planctomycetota bacterium]